MSPLATPGEGTSATELRLLGLSWLVWASLHYYASDVLCCAVPGLSRV